MTFTQTLKETHTLVWDFRRDYHEYWATPKRIEALRFAVTEVAEAMDAWIRATSPYFSRNRDKQSGLVDELADTVIMLVTALGQDFDFDLHEQSMRVYEGGHRDDPVTTTVDEIVIGVTRAFETEILDQAGDPIANAKWSVLGALARIYNYHPVAYHEVNYRLGRIYNKHVYGKNQDV